MTDAPSLAATQIRADRDRFVALAFCWADTLIELDSDLTIVFAAGLTMVVTGHGPEALVGRHIDDVLTPEDRPELRRLLAVAETCGRIDNVSITFAGPDGDGVPVELAAHKLPDLGDQSFLAMRLAGPQVAQTGPVPISGDPEELMGADAFVTVARQRLCRRGDSDGAVLTLISLPEMAALRQRPRNAAFRNLSSTISGYLKARSADRSTAARLADGRYGLIHDPALDVARLETHLLSIVNQFEPSDAGGSIESASIVPNASLSPDAFAQVLAYAIRQFRDSARTGFTLQQLRDDLPKVAADAAEMASTFTQLVDRKAFHIAFQPVVRCDGGEILFFESLARIDGRGDESPSKYIGYAEEAGHICEFDLAMTGKALAWLADTAAPDARISINVSGLSMLDPEFITRLHRVLDAHSTPAERLAFEITDSARIENLDAADQLIQSLRQRGHLVGLDDFAAELSGFRILTALDVDFVKLNRNAAAAARECERSRALLSSLAGYCRMLDIRTVATAVETRETLAFLGGCGIDYAQGYLFGKPSADIDVLRPAEPSR